VRYHLRRAAQPRLLIPLLIMAGMLQLGFTAGGTEVGDRFGPWGVARLYAVMTPLLLVSLVAVLSRLWHDRDLEDNWLLSGAGRVAVVKDTYRNFLAGFLVYAAFVAALAVFAAFRLADTAAWSMPLLIVTAVGPLSGGYAVLGIAYAVARTLGGAVARSAVVIFLVSLDVINQLPWLPLSASATSLAANRALVWGVSLKGETFVDVVPSTAFILARVVLVVVTTVAVALAALRVHRRLYPR
jgi:hypothetical protein